MPWLGYFHKMDSADVFVYLDNVQFKKNEYQNRNRIKTSQGWQWLTVPVNYSFGERINQVRIDSSKDWKKKHLKSIEMNYSKAPYFDEYFPMVERLYGGDYEYLYEVNIASVELLSGLIGIKKPAYRASEINGLRDDQNLRLLDICKALGADTYLSGGAGRDYMDLTVFKDEGVDVVFQDFTHPSYAQLYGEFTPFMSLLDILFNCGEKSLTILRG